MLLRRTSAPRDCGVDSVDNCKTTVAHRIHTAYYCCYGYGDDDGKPSPQHEESCNTFDSERSDQSLVTFSFDRAVPLR